MNRAIFYRHWLEIRGGLAVTGIATVLIAVIGAVVLASSAGSPTEASGLATHAWATAAAGLVAAMTVTGSGIRTNDFQPGHPSFQYTLTLPVHRTSWILTRFAAGVAGTIGSLAVIFIADAVAVAASGNAVPLSAMARTTVTIGLVAVTAGTLSGVVFPLWRDWLQVYGWTFFFTAAVLFASNALNDHSPFPAWPRPVDALVQRPPDPWTMVAATVLILAGLVWIGITIARKNDF